MSDLFAYQVGIDVDLPVERAAAVIGGWLSILHRTRPDLVPRLAELDPANRSWRDLPNLDNTDAVVESVLVGLQRSSSATDDEGTPRRSRGHRLDCSVDGDTGPSISVALSGHLTRSPSVVSLRKLPGLDRLAATQLMDLVIDYWAPGYMNVTGRARRRVASTLRDRLGTAEIAACELVWMKWVAGQDAISDLVDLEQVGLRDGRLLTTGDTPLDPSDDHRVGIAVDGSARLADLLAGPVGYAERLGLGPPHDRGGVRFDGVDDASKTVRWALNPYRDPNEADLADLMTEARSHLAAAAGYRVEWSIGRPSAATLIESRLSADGLAPPKLAVTAEPYGQLFRSD